MRNATPGKPFVLVALDETGGWTDPALVEACGGQIFTLYTFDPGEYTYACEMTPSYWLEPVGVEPASIVSGLGERDSEQLWEELSEGFNHGCEGIYVHAHRIDALGDEYKLTEKFDSEETLDDAREYFLSNGYAPPVLLP